MASTGDTRRSYDRVAAQYATELGQELVAKPLDRALLNTLIELAGAGVIADVGCGPGHVAGHLAASGARVVGLDLSPTMCALGRTSTSLPFAAADMTHLPVRSEQLAAIVSLYAVIHLDDDGRRAAYREFARALRPHGTVLIAFHTGDADTDTGASRSVTDFMGQAVELTFHFLDADTETRLLAAAGLTVIARLDRHPYPGVEHPSRRSYLLARRG
jgi:SAM-dependent methyltransferase